ncbi:hypothetical protein B0H13DRAFT_2120458 [Mycena leptocephala]|nr:hypothetical protein B0H13DRAFT_2120458 [Mycena leptocephala]
MMDIPRPDSQHQSGSKAREAALSLLKSKDLEPSEASEMQGTQPESFLKRHSSWSLCLTLHAVLVLVHIALLISGIKHWEHHFTFAVEHQTVVSFRTTTIAMVFAATYTSILVFLVQKLAMQQNLRTYQTLTATHDSITSWAGLGSALLHSSVFGTLNIVIYLGCISILHITIPANLSVATFSTTVPVDAITVGVPEFQNSTTVIAIRDFITSFCTDFLPWTGSLDDFQLLGLYNGSLHEVLQNTTSGRGQASVSATGFNITCGYIHTEILNVLDMHKFNISLVSGDFTLLDLRALHQNQLSVLTWDKVNSFNGGGVCPVSSQNSIFIYTTNLNHRWS